MLLAEGHSARSIAREVGCHHATVLAVKQSLDGVVARTESTEAALADRPSGAQQATSRRTNGNDDE